MKKAAIKKLNSSRGSGIAEALVGFLISVLSVITLLSVATTTLELIKQSDASLLVLYQDEGAMDQFINGNEPLAGVGTTYEYHGGVHYTINAEGLLRTGQNCTGIGDLFTSPTANVKYYVTNSHHLFGFAPSLD